MQQGMAQTFEHGQLLGTLAWLGPLILVKPIVLDGMPSQEPTKDETHEEIEICLKILHHPSHVNEQTPSQFL